VLDQIHNSGECQLSKGALVLDSKHLARSVVFVAYVDYILWRHFFEFWVEIVFVSFGVKVLVQNFWHLIAQDTLLDAKNEAFACGLWSFKTTQVSKTHILDVNIWKPPGPIFRLVVKQSGYQSHRSLRISTNDLTQYNAWIDANELGAKFSSFFLLLLEVPNSLLSQSLTLLVGNDSR